MKYLVALLSIVLVTFNVKAQQDAVRVSYAKSITTEDLERHLLKLTSDEFEGRETGEPGQKLAAEYIGYCFDQMEYFSRVKDGYLQSIPMKRVYPEGAEIAINGKTFEQNKDFYYFPRFGDTIIHAGSITFMGYGIEATEGYSDYNSETDIEGKVVAIMLNEPMDEKGNSFLHQKDDSVLESSGNFRKKITIARKYGAAAVLLIDDELEGNIDKRKHYLERVSMSLDEPQQKGPRSQPYFFISQEMADGYLEKNGSSIAQMKKKIAGGKSANNKEIDVKLMLKVNRKKEKFETENVLGFLEGSDLKDEILVLTAHYDHLGKHHGEIFYGADDNGTGTSAILELAEAFSMAKKAGHGPRRSILFMLVSGEEKGLLGSKYYTNNPVYPLESTIANLNIDMIGRNDTAHTDPNYVYVIGSDKLSSALHEISETTNDEYTNMELDYTFNDPSDPNRLYYRSDHYNFASRGVPAIFYFGGFHEDYHKATDTADKIDFEKVRKTSELVFYTAWELANRDERIEVDVVNDFED